MALQDPDGRWARGIYTPKWTSTTYTLVLLRSFGLPRGNPQALRGCQRLLDQGFCNDGGINFCPRVYRHSGMVLAVVGWFGLDDPRMDRLAGHLAGQQMADGGWNCRARPGYGHATHGSSHTTISVLEGLMEYERTRGQARGLPTGGRLFSSSRTWVSRAAGTLCGPCAYSGGGKTGKPV